MVTLAWLGACRRTLYVRWREPLATLGALVYSVAAVEEALRSSIGSHVERHGGSTLRLLGSMAAHSPAIMLLLYAARLYAVKGRLSLAWGMVVQPLLAAYPIINGRRLCVLALDTRGTPALMHELRRRLALIFGAPFVLLDTTADRSASSAHMEDCIAVHAFTVVLCMVALPLLAVRAFEQRRRRLQKCWEEQQQRAAQAAEQAHNWWMWSPVDLPPSSSSHQQQRQRQQQGGGGGGARQQAAVQEPRQRRLWWADGGSDEDEDEEAAWLEDDAAEAAAEDWQESIPRPLEGLLHLYFCTCLSWAASAWLAALVA